MLLVTSTDKDLTVVGVSINNPSSEARAVASGGIKLLLCIRPLSLNGRPSVRPRVFAASSQRRPTLSLIALTNQPTNLFTHSLTHFTFSPDAAAVEIRGFDFRHSLCITDWTGAEVHFSCRPSGCYCHSSICVLSSSFAAVLYCT